MKKKYTKAVVIGRFNPVPHKGHVSLYKKALEVAETVYILIGSANRFPDVKDPVPYDKRKMMIDALLSTVEFSRHRERIKVLPLNDYKYNDERWKTEVRFKVDEVQSDKIAMIGFNKDEDSYWLTEFGWSVEEVEPYMVNYYGKRVPMSSTFIRDSWLRTGIVPLTGALPAISTMFLHSFQHNNDGSMTDEFARLQSERKYWDKELSKFDKYPYAGSLNCCTADSVVLCNNHILLIERKFEPGKGAFALPGGHKDSNETFRYCALRELEEEVKLKIPSKVLRGSIRGQQLFDDPKRSPVLSKPTVAQFIVLQPDADGSLPKVRAASDAKRAMWVPLHEIMRNPAMLFEDHYSIIAHFTGI